MISCLILSTQRLFSKLEMPDEADTPFLYEIWAVSLLSVERTSPLGWRKSPHPRRLQASSRDFAGDRGHGLTPCD